MSAKNENPKLRYTLRIDEEVWKNFNDHCEQHLITKNVLIEELIKQYLDSKVYLHFK